ISSKGSRGRPPVGAKIAHADSAPTTRGKQRRRRGHAIRGILVMAVCRPLPRRRTRSIVSSDHERDARRAQDPLRRDDPLPSGTRRQPLTVFEALDWAAIDHIPPLAEPARLPPGAGTAVLNLVAALAADQEIARLRYRGPYPTETLFTALLEAFRYAEGDAAPLDRFRAGQLDWAPAPHERHFEPGGAAVQLRDGVEKVVWRGQAYYRSRWQSVARYAPWRVHETEGTVRCSLWALGAVVEDHLVLDPAGHVLSVLEPAPDPRHSAPVNPEVQAGLEALVRAQSVPALAGAVAGVMAALAIEWAGLAGGLVEVTGARARLAWTLADAGGARIRAAGS